MSSDLHFQAVFDAAFKEYFNKTGNDIVQDPLVHRLRTCGSPEDVLGILQDRARAFNESQQGGRGVQLMRKLKPIVNILFAISNAGVLGNAVGLVSAHIRVLDTIIVLLWAYCVSHPTAISSCKCDICRNWAPTRGTLLVSFPFAELTMPAPIRRLKVLARATTCL